MAERTGIPVSEVKNCIIWGNHSSSQYPDVAHGTAAGKPIKEAVADDAWLSGDFISTVQQRGAAIIKVQAFFFVIVSRCCLTYVLGVAFVKPSSLAAPALEG